MTNPYAAPTSDDDVSGTTRNPAKNLLIVFGVICLCLCYRQPRLAMTRGLPFSWFLGGVTVAFLWFGITAFWLGLRRYDSKARLATIAFGSLAIPMTLNIIVPLTRLQLTFPFVVVMTGISGLALGLAVLIPVRAIYNRPSGN